MSNELSQEGFGNIAFQDVKESTINITQQLGKSAQYNELLTQLNTLKDLLSYIPEAELEKRLIVKKQINDLEGFIAQFQRDVLKLAETFNRIEINTGRLIRAKELFDNGDFAQSRVVIESEIELIKDEQKQLLERRETYEKTIVPKLEHNSDEFLILALSKIVDYKNPNKFADTCECFELSLRSFEAHRNLFLYAQFLAHNNSYQKAKEYWEKCLKYFDEESFCLEKAELLNNIAIAHSYADNYDEAKSYYERALTLGRKIENQKQTKESKTFIAYILNNLGNFLTNILELDESEKNLIEALEIRKNLMSEDSLDSIDNVAVTLLNLGVVYLNKEEYEKSEDFFKESLEIFESLINEIPFYAFQQIALIKNNLGDLYWKTGSTKLAEENFKESVNLHIALVNIDPFQTAPNAVLSLSNLALFYRHGIENREESITMAFNAMVLALPTMEGMANVAREFGKARKTLLDWGLSDEEIDKYLDSAIEELSAD